MKKKVNWIPAGVFYCASSVLSLSIDPIPENYLWMFLLSPVYILAVVFAMILLFKCWKALPEAHRKTTPGKAVGFLFIPLYNFYWVFVSFPALAKGYYLYGQQVNDAEIKDHSNVGVAYAMLFICSFTFAVFMPSIGPLINIADLVVFLSFFKTMSSYANRALNRPVEPVNSADSLRNR